MVDDILAFSTLTGQDHFRKISLKTIFDDTVELLEYAIKEKQASITSGHLPDAIVIKGR